LNFTALYAWKRDQQASDEWWKILYGGDNDMDPEEDPDLPTIPLSGITHIRAPTDWQDLWRERVELCCYKPHYPDELVRKEVVDADDAFFQSEYDSDSDESNEDSDTDSNIPDLIPRRSENHDSDSDSDSDTNAPEMISRRTLKNLNNNNNTVNETENTSMTQSDRTDDSTKAHGGDLHVQTHHVFEEHDENEKVQEKLSCHIKVSMSHGIKKSGRRMKIYNAVVDTGSAGSFIRRNALPETAREHEGKKTMWQTEVGKFVTNTTATVLLQLPQFTTSRNIVATLQVIPERKNAKYERELSNGMS
jgi:hypothetical protein